MKNWVVLGVVLTVKSCLLDRDRKNEAMHDTFFFVLFPVRNAHTNCNVSLMYAGILSGMSMRETENKAAARCLGMYTYQPHSSC